MGDFARALHISGLYVPFRQAQILTLAIVV